MNTQNDGGPAFPSHGSMGEVAHEGMFLRDYFAAKAMQSCVADPSWRNDHLPRTCALAYQIADAMLKAREA